MNLTPKQDRFCQLYIETGNASEAYRQSYNACNMKPETINRKAKELLDNGKIRARVEGLQTEHQERHNINVDYLTAKLEAIYTLATERNNPSAAVSAILGIAKLHGLLLVRGKFEHSGDFVQGRELTDIERAARVIFILKKAEEEKG